MLIPFVEVHAVDHCNQNCRWCHNYSPFSPKREYRAEDYTPWLDLLRKKGVKFNMLSIMGGEPMLHSDLTKFVYTLQQRYKVPMLLTTNGFWLSEEAVDAHSLLWKLFYRIKISRYPLIDKRLGGYERMKRLAERITKHNPIIHIEFPEKSAFNRLEFTEEPREVEMYCGNSECTALLPSGIMGRCGAGAYTHLAPEGTLPNAFLESRHMCYDLKSFDMRSFKLWRKRYPLDACELCNFAFPLKRTESWKVEKGHRPFNTDYETEFYLNGATQSLNHDNLDIAQALLDNVSEGDKQSAEALNAQGVIAFKRGNSKEALALFRAALDQDETYADAASNYNYVKKSMR